MLEAITTRLEAMASRLEATAIWLEAIASRIKDMCFLHLLATLPPGWTGWLVRSINAAVFGLGTVERQGVCKNFVKDRNP